MLHHEGQSGERNRRASARPILRNAGGEMGQQFLTVPLHRIYLDNENPRHDPIDNEREIIAYLLRKERVGKLAMDIAEHGTSPLDRLGVIEHPAVPGSYVALEGNRRVCALKLLIDPEKAPTESYRRVFRELRARTRLATSIDVVVFASRAAARHWLRVRHEGELEGVGTKNWKSAQKTRFNATVGSGDNPNLLARELLEYAQHRRLVDADALARISQTTLTRFLSNPVFRHAVGLTSHKELRSDAPQEQVEKAVAKFLSDAATRGSVVNSRTDAHDRRAYATKLMREGYSPTDRGGVDARLHPDSGKMDRLPRRDENKAHNSRNPDKRSTVIPHDFRFRIADRVQKRIFDELRSINAEDFAFASAYLLRAFIETTALAYARAHRLAKRDRNLHLLVGDIADHLQRTGVPANELKALRVMANNQHSGYSPHSLGAAVHGAVIPTRAELNRYWDSMATGLQHILTRI